MGSVDDAIQHEGPAFNDDLAASGYTITVTASDGYSTEFASAAGAESRDPGGESGGRAAASREILPLAPGQFGPGQESKLVGMISEMALSLEPVPTPEARSCAVGRGCADRRWPRGDAQTVFTDADLRTLGVVTKTLEHPKKGATEYEVFR